MTYAEWVVKAARLPVDDSAGIAEHWFNLVLSEKPDVACRVLGSRALCPIRDPENLNRFLQFVRACWV